MGTVADGGDSPKNGPGFKADAVPAHGKIAARADRWRAPAAYAARALPSDRAAGGHRPRIAKAMRPAGVSRLHRTPAAAAGEAVGPVMRLPLRRAGQEEPAPGGPPP